MTNYIMKTLEIFLNIYISSDENESILSSEALSQFYYKIYFSKKKKKKKKNARHPYGVLHSFSIKDIFYDRMDFRFFYFRVTIYNLSYQADILF